MMGRKHSEKCRAFMTRSNLLMSRFRICGVSTASIQALSNTGARFCILFMSCRSKVLFMNLNIFVSVFMWVTFWCAGTLWGLTMVICVGAKWIIDYMQYTWWRYFSSVKTSAWTCKTKSYAETIAIGSKLWRQNIWYTFILRIEYFDIRFCVLFNY